MFGELLKRSQYTYRQARRLVVLLLGGSVVAIGIAMLVLPGPGTVVIPLGLAILAIEFAWARRWLLRIRKSVDDVRHRVTGGNTTKPSTDSARTGGKLPATRADL